MWPPETFQARYTPTEYDDLVESYELDPPLDHLLRATNRLLAELLAVYHHINFRDTNGDTIDYTADQFLRTPDDSADEDDDGEAVEQSATDAALAIAAAANPFGAVATGHGLVMGSGSKPPESVMSAFFGASPGQE